MARALSGSGRYGPVRTRLLSARATTTYSPTASASSAAASSSAMPSCMRSGTINSADPFSHSAQARTDGRSSSSASAIARSAHSIASVGTSRSIALCAMHAMAWPSSSPGGSTSTSSTRLSVQFCIAVRSPSSHRRRTSLRSADDSTSRRSCARATVSSRSACATASSVRPPSHAARAAVLSRETSSGDSVSPSSASCSAW
jgi:hypothetical protein